MQIGLSFRSGLPTKLAAEWFSQSEHDTVNSIASLADPMGTSLAFLIVPFIAEEPSDLSYLQLYFVIPIILSFTGSLFIRREGYSIETRDQSLKEKIATLEKIDFMHRCFDTI